MRNFHEQHGCILLAYFKALFDEELTMWFSAKCLALMVLLLDLVDIGFDRFQDSRHHNSLVQI